MFKNKNFWVGFFVALAVFVLLGEIQRSSTRSAAVSDLNKAWPTLSKDADKGLVLVRTNTILEQNKSWFDFSNSSADEEDGNGGPKEFGLEYFRGPLNLDGWSNVITGWVWFDAETGRWVDGQ